MIWRETDKIGAMRRLTQDPEPHGSFKRLRKGDFLLCLKHTGDCHYAYAVLELRCDNGHSVYFRLVDTVSGYGHEASESVFPHLPLVTAKAMVTMFLNQELVLKREHLIDPDWVPTIGLRVRLANDHSNTPNLFLAEKVEPNVWTVKGGAAAMPPVSTDKFRELFRPVELG